MKPLLGGKGANLAEMCRIGLPVPPGFTITTEVCTYYYANKRTYPPTLRSEMESGHRLARAADRQEVRRPEEPAARLGALRRPRLDAGHDGHDPQPRPERRDRRGAGDQDRQPALRVGLLPPLRPDVLRRRARRAEAGRRGSRSVRDGHSRPQARALSPGHRRHEADRRRSQGAGRALQGPGQGPVRQAVPEIAVGPAARRRRRGLRIVDERPGDRLPPQVQHPDRVGHRRQRPGDGLRQHRRELRLGRRVHAQPGERRQGVLRRVPDQRAGGGRRRRRAHAGAGRRAEEGRCRRPTPSSSASARRSRSTSRTSRTSSSPSRTASSTCCRRATASAPRWRR